MAIATVTFPAAERRRIYAGTKLYCSVTEARVCEGRFPKAHRPGIEPVNC